MSQISTIGRTDAPGVRPAEMPVKPLATLAQEKEETMTDSDNPPNTYMKEADDPAQQSRLNVTLPGHEHICPYCGVGIYCDDINKRISPNTCEMDADYICSTCQVLNMTDENSRILKDNEALNAKMAEMNKCLVKYQADLANANANYLKVDAEANNLAAKLAHASEDNEQFDKLIASQNKLICSLTKLINDLADTPLLADFVFKHRAYLDALIRAARSEC